MDRERIDKALERLEAAAARVERAGRALASAAPQVDPAEHAGLQERHTQLKQTVARSLRQLDEILAGASQ
jgi:hypothetical protein